ncbi:efflux RND transporter periplasmic adaptor subunit [Pelagicoccus sp. SDUM812002]|uniref:efflux RND transporter periplasmic adaptor subunit n=1 Tax=Pelagicoccus sp. SDUM812002 TaxID=3041266 RepID=UPI00280DAE5C|nr:efflux RND transporter periplasmic adaptor subunit [Pelagicoccus sp. SDUM812002]MDQ8185498.1 efflux RND transporter periplasmic adaptor subunit [Pelagicoccus sp. SDUM812002]
MKTKTYSIIGFIVLIILTFLLGRCSAPDSPSSPEHSTEINVENQKWTCSMHPQIQQAAAGTCPICGMDLIPVSKDSDADLGPRAMSMSASSKSLADIQTTPVIRRFPEAEIRLVGKLDYDETKVKSLTARFPARIDDLFVNFIGVPVQKGDHLAIVYSPELLTAQSELLTAHRYDPDSSAARAAREKLRLWDLLPEQIESILASGQATDRFELKAPINGIVVQKNVDAGDYVKTGQPLFKIVDMSELWLQLEAYESDLAWLRFGQTVTFSVEAYPGQTFTGKVAFIEPELDRATRTVSVRVNVKNNDRKLKPGMFAKAIAHSKLAASGTVFSPEYAGKWISPMHPEIVKDHPGQCDVCGMDLVPAEELGYIEDPNTQAPLVIPASSVLRTGKRAVVYIEKPNTSRPTFEGREIELGPRAGDVFLVSSGLNEGDRVVTQGAFKIDSALQIQAKPSMMNPIPASVNAEPADIDTLAAESVAAALPSYLELQTALAADDLRAAKVAVDGLHHSLGHGSPIDSTLHALVESQTLDEIRRPHFETLSRAFLEAVSENPDIFSQELYRMHCPMVYPDRGADWLQSSGDLRNPYFGASMLTCGEVIESY